jgi:anti-sigma factor ChrR (cupin superfamily)
MTGETPGLRGAAMLAELSSRYVEVEHLPWTRAGAGIEQKILFEDRERGLRTALFRWQPGARLPMHEHVDFEQTYVLEGSLCDQEGECKAGDYVWRPPGSRHEAWSPDGCLLLAIFLKPNIFSEKSGSEAAQ